MKREIWSVVLSGSECRFVVAWTEIFGDALELAAVYKDGIIKTSATVYVVEGYFSWAVE